MATPIKEDAPVHLMRVLDGEELLVAAGSRLFVLRQDGHGPLHALPDQHIAPVRDAVVAGSWVATAGDDKRVVLWGRAGGAWGWQGTVTLRKKVAQLALDLPPNGALTVLAADKFGQCLALRQEQFSTASAAGRAVAEEGGAALLGGHYAMITAMLLVPGTPRLLVTADRDEKVRVARYPQAYDIQAYCLGHGAFVAALADLGRQGEAHWLVTAGADGRLALWNALRGHLVAQLHWPGILRALQHVAPLRVLVLALEEEAAVRVVRVGGTAEQPELLELGQLALPAPALELVAWAHAGLQLLVATQAGSVVRLHVELEPSLRIVSEGVETALAGVGGAFRSLSEEEKQRALQSHLLAALKKGTQLASSARGPPRDEDDD